jgi:hypothetical protein
MMTDRMSLGDCEDLGQTLDLLARRIVMFGGSRIAKELAEHEAQPILESLVTDAERFAWMSDEDFHGFVLKSIASSM